LVWFCKKTPIQFRVSLVQFEKMRFSSDRILQLFTTYVLVK